MPERPRKEQSNISAELTIDPRVVNALRGEISQPIQTISHRPGSEGIQVEVRLAKEGPGLFGLIDWKDNKEWSGITNHVLLSTRYAVYFAQEMAKAGHQTNPQRILNGGIGSHSGRRQSDEAGWYPEAVADAKSKRSISNETLGMQLIQGKVPQDAFDLVVALGHNVEGFSVDPAIYDSWDFKIAIYVDHRTAQTYEPLNTRMGDFLLGNFFDRSNVTEQVREAVYETLKKLIEDQKAFRLGKEGAKEVTLDQADQIAESLGAKPDSQRLTRRELMRLILQDADTEAALIEAGIDPDDVNDETVPMPAWENEFRTEYVRAAEDSIVKELSSRIQTPDQFDADFSLKTWWGQYARQIFSEWYAKNVDSWDPLAPHY